MKYKELASRIKREQELAKAERELEIQRAMGVSLNQTYDSSMLYVFLIQLFDPFTIRAKERRRRLALT
jgi:hypothetical protein